MQTGEDDVSHSRNLKILSQEFAKSKPRFDIVTELMSRTFTRRRQVILDEPRPVKDICDDLGFLRKVLYVSSTINRKREGACNVCRRALLILHVLGPVCGSCSIGLCGHENLSLICWALI